MGKGSPAVSIRRRKNVKGWGKKIFIIILLTFVQKEKSKLALFSPGSASFSSDFFLSLTSVRKIWKSLSLILSE